MIYHFNTFELDTNNFSLKRSGTNLAIEPQVFNLIVYLINNHNKVVTRDELFANVWSGREVSDATLSNHVNSARSLLGDDGNQQKVIKTIRSRGYQFVAPLNDEAIFKPEAPAFFRVAFWRNWPSFSTVLVITFIGLFFLTNDPNSASNQERSITKNQKTVVVLPLRNVSEVKEDSYFMEGFCGDLTAKMSKLTGVKVISHLSVRDYLDANKNVDEITTELNATNLLTGAMSRSGSKIKINVQLIDVQSKEHMWAETYTRDLNLNTMFSVQSEVTSIISHKLESLLVANVR